MGTVLTMAMVSGVGVLAATPALADDSCKDVWHDDYTVGIVCSRLGSGTQFRATAICRPDASTAYGAWKKPGETSYAYCSTNRGTYSGLWGHLTK